MSILEELAYPETLNNLDDLRKEVDLRGKKNLKNGLDQYLEHPKTHG